MRGAVGMVDMGLSASGHLSLLGALLLLSLVAAPPVTAGVKPAVAKTAAEPKAQSQAQIVGADSKLSHRAD